MAKSKINQKRVKELLADYSAESKKLLRANNGKATELKPITTEIDLRFDAINAEFADQINKVSEKYAKRISSAEDALKNIEAEIKQEMKKGFDGKKYDLLKIETDGAEVKVVTIAGSRTVDVMEWLKAIPNAKRIGTFAETIKVQLTKAEKFDGDLVKKLQKQEDKQDLSITLKD